MKQLPAFFFATVSLAFAQTHAVPLTWADSLNPPKLTTYTVYRAPGLCSGTPSFANIAAKLTAMSYTDTSVASGNWCFTVTATVSGAESAQAPGVQAMVPSAHAVPLTWADSLNPPKLTTYTVYRAPGLCSGTPLVAKIAAGLTVMTYTDTTVTSGNQCYTVTATVGGTESAQAPGVQATVPASTVFPVSALQVGQVQ